MGVGGSKGQMWGLISLVVFHWGFSSSMGVTDGTAADAKARQLLAQKLLRLSKSLDMKEASFTESGGGGGKSFDANTGNSFTSTTTYHSYVWDFCESWIAGQFCERWRSRYISPHAFTADSSPLEQVVGREWMKRRGKDTGDTFEIWQIKRAFGGGSNTDSDGKLDLKGVTDFRILPEIQKQIEDVGERTADRTVSVMFDDNASKNDGKTMPTMETLRFAAQRFTKMFRNRLVSIIGEVRASQPGVEMPMGEDAATCELAAQKIQQEMEDTRLEERAQPQARLDPETRASELSERVQKCKALRQASAYMVNAKSSGNGVQEGDVNEEQVDLWRARVNLALVDRVGLNVNEVPKPSFAQITNQDMTSELTFWENGGLKQRGKIRMTNAQQLQAYNNALEAAAAGMQEVAMRSSRIPDTSKDIKKFKIQRGTRNLVNLNGMTPEMKRYLASTGFPRTGNSAGGKNPEVVQEQTPAELTQNR